MAAYGGERASGERETRPVDAGAFEDGWEDRLRLGQELRIVLVAVGGGAIRIVREVAQRHLRHVETVAINCDPKVQAYDEFDRRVYLGPDSGAEVDTGGSPLTGGVLARAAVPALERIFEGATFVIVVGSLGGGAGSGALPCILEVASRNAEVVSAFVVKPFRCEGDRRALADRTIGRLPFVDAFVEKRERGYATLQTLDNESLVKGQARLPFARISEHWANVIEDHIERSFLVPAEALLETARLDRASRATPMNEVTLPEVPIGTPPPAPVPPDAFPPILPAAPGAEVELTFEVVDGARPPPIL